MTENFADFISRERERLHAEREAIFNQQQELQQKLDAVNNEMRAIDAYESAKTGKAAAPPQPRRGPAPGQKRARRGSRRDAVLSVIRNVPSGLSRGEILDQMRLKGDKAGEMSVSNALTALIKSHAVDRRDGKYRIVG